MGKPTMIPIIGPLLKDCIENVGVTLSYASAELGYSDNFFANCCDRNQISRPAAVSLKTKFGIPLTEYQRKDNTDPAHGVIVKPHIDYDELYKTIYSAVYEAVKKAWNGE